jgi:hypothetical protein
VRLISKAAGGLLLGRVAVGKDSVVIPISCKKVALADAAEHLLIISGLGLVSCPCKEILTVNPSSSPTIIVLYYVFNIA